MQIIEVYDWNQGRWDILGFNTFSGGAGGDETSQTIINQAARYTSPLDKSIYVRQWMLGIGTGSSGIGGAFSDPFLMRLDFVNLELSDQGIFPSGGG